MNIKKTVLILLVIVIILSLVILAITANKNIKKSEDKLSLVVSNFASYDFLRAIIKDTGDAELTFLLGPGKDAHSYEPTAQDLIAIQNADLFVYVGGEIEVWTEKVLNTLEQKSKKIICISDDIEKIKEKEVDGAETHSHNHDDEHLEETDSFDEHIWTSPANAKIMLFSLEKVMEELNPAKKDIYQKNASEYANQIDKVDRQIQEIVSNKVRNRLVFADKMPMQYFMDYYKLDVTAAFSGCSTETEPSSQTIAYLLDKIKSEKVPVVLYIELNTGKVANVIASEAGNGCKAMQIQTLHNLSRTDFENGETWVSLMQKNIEVLKTALQ